MIAVIIIFRFFNSVSVYQIIITAGCVFRIIASIQLFRVPESSAPSVSAQETIKQSLKPAWKNTVYRWLLFAWAAGFSIFAIVIPFAVITLKRGYGISDYSALIFSLLLLIAGYCKTGILISLMFSLRDLRTLFIINRADSDNSSEEDADTVEKLSLI